ncbi:hypothetical protein I5497_24595 [Citrobacter freundii]|nr:hypothetical protein [Citrobacter freundii]
MAANEETTNPFYFHPLIAKSLLQDFFWLLIKDKNIPSRLIFNLVISSLTVPVGFVLQGINLDHKYPDKVYLIASQVFRHQYSFDKYTTRPDIRLNTILMDP